MPRSALYGCPPYRSGFEYGFSWVVVEVMTTLFFYYRS